MALERNEQEAYAHSRPLYFPISEIFGSILAFREFRTTKTRYLNTPERPEPLRTFRLGNTDSPL